MLCPQRILISLLIGIACIGPVACGEDDESPTARCEAFVRRTCQKLADCVGRDFNVCIAESQIDLPCDQSSGTSATYDQCLDDIDTATCETVRATPDQLPPSCTGIILFEEDPQVGG